MKRLFDIIFSSIVLIIFFPLGIIIMIILRFTGEGEILYIQPRIGKNGMAFNCFKFTTMVKDSPNLGAGDITLKDDHRVLPFGKYLRKSKLNEFPQFINVFLGEMSIVGPRPLVKNQYDWLSVKYKKKIKLLKPGLTGIGSVIFRNEEYFLQSDKNDAIEFYKNNISPYKGELELWYQKHQSFYTDFMVIFLTAWAIVVPENNLVFQVFKDLPQKPEALKWGCK